MKVRLLEIRTSCLVFSMGLASSTCDCLGRVLFTIERKLKAVMINLGMNTRVVPVQLVNGEYNRLGIFLNIYINIAEGMVYGEN